MQNQNVIDYFYCFGYLNIPLITKCLFKKNVLFYFAKFYVIINNETYASCIYSTVYS